MKTQAAAPEIPIAEWIASGLGFLLVAGTVGYMAHAAVTKEDRPPDIRVEITSVERVGQGYLARFRAMNHGDLAANDVHILGQHREGGDAGAGAGGVVEESDATLDFLPAQCEKSGGLFFTREPVRERLSVRAAGYQEP